MISCSKSVKLISRYIDNDLEPAAHRSVEAHLASCRDCKKLLNDYAALKHLVVESYTRIDARVQKPAHEYAYDGKPLRFPVWNSGFKLAAMLTLTCSLAAAFFIHTSSKKALSLPSIIERDSRMVMNTPLGALVYYEEWAGKTVHAQYGGITESSSSLNEETGVCKETITSYKSPLFCDTAFTRQNYRSITSMSVF
jgi:hypothetical protein